MKKKLIIILLFIPLLLNANMASPVQAGTLVANPFLNQYVSVLHENIYVKLDDGFHYANFDIEYQIDAEKDGVNIPFLFYAYQYEGDFKVTIDGKEIELKEIKDFWDLYKEDDKVKFKNYTYLYQNKKEEISNTKETDGINLNDFLYFKTDITKGKHSIKVTYKASRWLYKHSRLNEYSFKYVLSPAKYWKSFGTLAITIDATDFKEDITTNLGNPTSGNINGVSTYQFNNLPTETMSITFIPKVSTFANILLKIGYYCLALLFMLPLVYFHYKLMKKYRKRNTTSKLSAIAILGGILLPLLFIFMLIFSSFFIDYFLGKHASGREGYGAFFSFFFLPKFILIYLPISIVIDLILKKNKSF